MPNLDLKVSTLEVNASPSKLELIKQETQYDPQMIMLKQAIIQGCPKEISQCPSQIKSYWNFRDELIIVDGVVVKSSCIVVPLKFRPELLTMLLNLHLGIDRCIQRAKGSVYWTGITEDIMSIVNKCEKCLSHSRHNQKELFIPIDIPMVAWKVVATDLFVF